MSNVPTFKADDIPIAVCFDGDNGQGTSLRFFEKREDVTDPNKAKMVIDFPSNADMFHYIRIVYTMLHNVHAGLNKRLNDRCPKCGHAHLGSAKCVSCFCVNRSMQI